MTKLQPVGIIGSFPGPVTGVTVINQGLFHLLEGRLERVIRIDLSPRAGAYHATRIIRTLIGMVRILAFPARMSTRYIMSLDGGAGLIYNIALAATAAVRGSPLLLYHHSSSYIHSDSRLMRLLIGLTGKRAVHVMCSVAMLSAFRRRYGASLPGLVVSNAAWVSLPELANSDHGPVLRLGHLSGLNSEKGLERVFETLRELARRNCRAELVLAGMAQGAEAERSLSNAKEEFGEALRHVGVVTGDKKSSFYNEIDYFLFPSLYRHETQSLVVPEALAAGVPVIAYDHRFVSEVLGSGGLLIPEGAAFANVAADWILSGGLEERRKAARAQAEKSCAEALDQIGAVLDWASHGVDPMIECV
jgi:glycosyltransferase involved in cell wall biosynthesis